MSPVFPPELERDIFEIVALSGTKCIPPLLRVAQRVKFWLEPLLYHVIVVRDEKSALRQYASRDPIATSGHALLTPTALTAAISRHPPAFFDQHVRHLFLDCRVYLPSALAQRNLLVAACTGVTDVYLATIQDAPSLAAALTRLPSLTRLQANLAALFADSDDFDPLTVPEIDFAVPLFRHLTHLTAFDNLAFSGSDWRMGLALLPALTHLSFTANHPHPLFADVFALCATLRVFVVLVNTRLAFQRLHAALPDPRAVILDSISDMLDMENNWHRGARGLGDHWEQAEELIRLRALQEGPEEPRIIYG
ncbi:hypothetical protein B0H14DRAFT_2638278 [Mycena olivaceomarginata]|nr:hypothetical protein B0H14DRAFT_2638278 [Mycena olivaceomarginata]